MFDMADLEMTQLAEEVTSLRGEMDTLRADVRRLVSREEKTLETTRLLEMLLVRIEETLIKAAPSQETKDDLDENEEETPPQEQRAEGDQTEQEETAEISSQEDHFLSLARDVAAMKDRLAADRAIAAEFRIDFDRLKNQLGDSGCSTVQEEQDAIRKEISALQSRLLRASLSGEV